MSGFQAKTYEYSGETTEWEDILIKKGIKMKESILEEKGLDYKKYMPEKYGPKDNDDDNEILEDPMASATLEELDILEDDFSDDNMLQKYREQRLIEMKEKTARDCYGGVKLIDKRDWTSEVNDCSHNNWVIVHMFQDSVIECRLMDEVINDLAAKFKYIKFVRIKSTAAVENWPDRNLPTLFMYHEGEARDQIMTLQNLGGKTMKLQDLEWALVQKGIIIDSELQDDPRSEESQLENAAGTGKLSPGSGLGMGQITHTRRSDKYFEDSDEDDDDDDLLS